MRVCPKCNRRMQRRAYEQIHLFACSGCGGVLVHADDLEKTKRDRDLAESQLSTGLGRAERSDSDRVLNCTACLRPMDKAHYVESEPEEQRGMSLDFHLDVCRQCQYVFLDAGELEAIQLSFERSAAGAADAAGDQTTPTDTVSARAGGFSQFLRKLFVKP